MQHLFAEAAERVASSELRYLFRRYELLHARFVEKLLQHAAAAGLQVAFGEVARHPAIAASLTDQRLVESCLLEQRHLLACNRAARVAVPSLSLALDRSARVMADICDELARYLETAAGSYRPAAEFFEGGTAPRQEPPRYD